MSEPYKFYFGFRRFVIREEMIEALEGYVQNRLPVGCFLQAILENNLVEALGRADEQNLLNIPAYGAWLYNEAPGNCWGSPEIVKEWLKARIPTSQVGG